MHPQEIPAGAEEVKVAVSAPQPSVDLAQGPAAADAEAAIAEVAEAKPDVVMEAAAVPPPVLADDAEAAPVLDSVMSTETQAIESSEVPPNG